MHKQNTTSTHTYDTHTYDTNNSMEPSEEYLTHNFVQGLKRFDDDAQQKMYRELFLWYSRVRVYKNCQLSKHLERHLKHYAAAEKHFQNKFGHDVICTSNGLRVKHCKLCVKYPEIVKVVRVHMKKCFNCRLQKWLLSSSYDCLKSMAVTDVHKSDEGYVINYTGMEGDYLNHCRDSMMPSYEKFCIN